MSRLSDSVYTRDAFLGPHYRDASLGPHYQEKLAVTLSQRMA